MPAIEAGIDYMEIGYKNCPKRFPKDKYGPWRHCDEEDLRRVVGDHTFEATGMKLCAMADAGGKSDWQNQIIPAKDSVLDMIRVACYVHQISEAAEMVQHCHELGYETTFNIMAISVVNEFEIDQALEIVAKSPAQVLVVVDSFGNLYREQIDHLVKKYIAAVDGTGMEVGIPRAQQPATRLRQHHRSHYPGQQSRRRHYVWARTRRGQLSDGDPARFSAQPEIQIAPGNRSDPEHHPAH